MKAFTFVPEGMSGCSVKAWIHDYEGADGIVQRYYPAVVICPGGGYRVVSARESEPAAIEYYKAGYNTFILTYSVGEDAKNFTPLKQLAATIAQIRANAESWVTRPDQIAVCGFSAGGHLTCCLGILYNNETFLKAYGRTEHIRPDAMILCYPGRLYKEKAYADSGEHASGSEQEEDAVLWSGLDVHVDSETPPTFMWHTASDEKVSVENSLRFSMALSAAKIPFECHIFPSGGHGMSTCRKEINTNGVSYYNARWMDWSIQWLNRLFEYEL